MRGGEEVEQCGWFGERHSSGFPLRRPAVPLEAKAIAKGRSSPARPLLNDRDASGGPAQGITF